MSSVSWIVYMLECADGTLYTGVTTDIDRRVAEHNGTGTARKGAKYTAARRPVRVVYSEVAANRSAAQCREAALRRLSRTGKQALAKINKIATLPEQKKRKGQDE